MKQIIRLDFPYLENYLQFLSFYASYATVLKLSWNCEETTQTAVGSILMVAMTTIIIY